ncbi:MAG: ATP phosphoribosyltransferase [Nitrospira sp.]|nr:ATP phosphoribosyltransferase [Nitrospira sp.]MCB9709844.1 ATP phosphoribosyltransferase [Nitrospiraceae bacterium]MDR4485949.1 ATP phosphoribosyltransferase [Nitrospirales bacterium]MCA9463932.1 ATP phosphoribosyltransferase [Nitrospira sp.]MCA9475579.1 ATP phosphoribosyltransferase [Nitrospira sp.]
MSKMLTIALSKGKLLEPTLALFAQAGFGGYVIEDDDRRLIWENPKTGHRLLIVRPSDVPAYVEHGAADIGVVGKDVLLEQNPDVYEPVDLGLGGCKLVVAKPKGQMSYQRLSSKLRVATKYPNMTERYFNQLGLPVEIIKLYGSIELAPLVGLADRIVDLVSTGKTLKANNLEEEDLIAWSTARLIVNRASMKMKHDVVHHLIDRVKKSLGKQSSKGTRG